MHKLPRRAVHKWLAFSASDSVGAVLEAAVATVVVRLDKGATVSVWINSVPRKENVAKRSTAGAVKFVALTKRT